MSTSLYFTLRDPFVLCSNEGGDFPNVPLSSLSAANLPTLVGSPPPSCSTSLAFTPSTGRPVVLLGSCCMPQDASMSVKGFASHLAPLPAPNERLSGSLQVLLSHLVPSYATQPAFSLTIGPPLPSCSPQSSLQSHPRTWSSTYYLPIFLPTSCP